MKLEPLKKGQAVYLVTPMRVRTMEETRAVVKPIEDKLRKAGLIVFSPSEMAEKTGQQPGDPSHDAQGFAWDVDRVRESNALVLLEGWEDSSGGMLEITIANNLGIPCLEYSTWEPPVSKPGAIINYRDLPAPVGQAVLRIISTFARKNADYANDGDWRSNFDAIAAQMGFDAVTACDTLVAVKQARLTALGMNDRRGATVNEAVEDTYLDLMVYCVIAYALLMDDAANG